MDSSQRTAFLFPGMSSLLKKGDRFRFLALPEVQARIVQAESLLREREPERRSLASLLELPTQDLYSLGNIHCTTMLISCMQLGVAERLQKIMPAPDWLVGCSLGDI